MSACLRRSVPCSHACSPRGVGQHTCSSTHPLTKADSKNMTEFLILTTTNYPGKMWQSTSNKALTRNTRRVAPPQVDLNEANPGVDRPPFHMPIRLVRMTELNSEPPSFAGAVCGLPQTQIDRPVSRRLSRGTLHCETGHPVRPLKGGSS